MHLFTGGANGVIKAAMGLCGYGKSGRESDLRAKLVVPAPPRRTVFRLHQLTSHLYPLKTFPCNTQLVAMSLLGKKFPTPIGKTPRWSDILLD